MSWMNRIIGRRRARLAARKLGVDPTPQNYVSLARELVANGDPEDVLRVCTEGLDQHPGEPTLARLAQRSRALMLGRRRRELQADLDVAPRAALWREMCELHLEVGRHDQAEAAAEDWWRATQDAEAIYYRARCRAEMFYVDRRAADGRVAYDLVLEASAADTSDDRPLRLGFELARRVGAWNEARLCLARLLELYPGDPDFEARFRAVQANLASAPTMDRALNEVERSGEFPGEEDEVGSAGDEEAARPLLQELGRTNGTHAAIYVRGGTALVQGPQGPTADRTARSVRDVLQSSRAAARRIGLGPLLAVELEGDFGTLVVQPGERGTAALWSDRVARAEQQELLDRLAGAAAGGQR